MYAILADVVVGVHLAYVSFVVFGQLLILVGWLRRWAWVRNPWFRWTHFTMMAIVVFEVLMGIECPLTTWEYQLRVAAGQSTNDGDSFIGRLMHNIMYINLPPWGFTLLYITFGGLILGSIIGYPPRKLGSRAKT